MTPAEFSATQRAWYRFWLPRIVIGTLVFMAIAFGGQWVFTSTTDFLMTMILSFFIAFAMLPAVDYLSGRGWKRGVATATVMFVGSIMVMSSVFQGFGKTYPVFIAAVFDNVLFACLVFTLPGLFGWGIQSVWWIKLITAGIEMLIIAEWLRRYFRGISSYLDEIPEGMR